MKDGVYFNMPEAEYHAIERLSASGIKNLHITPIDFWARSWMNLMYQPEETLPMKIGSAYHKRVLEGKGAFATEYYTDIDPADFPDALVTVADIKERLNDLGQKTTGNKPDLIDRLVAADSECLILDRLIEDNHIRNEGKINLPRNVIDEIEYAARFIELHPIASKAFTGGYPEVTVLWTDEETGVQMKSRLDYLKIGATVDLKTFSNPQRKAIQTAIHHAFGYNKYHTQMAVYHEARKQAIELIKAGQVEGGDVEFLEKLVTKEDWQTLVVWQQTGIAPYTQCYIFEHQSMAFIAGENSYREALNTFRDYMDKYGTDQWISGLDVETFEDEMLPYGTFE